MHLTNHPIFKQAYFSPFINPFIQPFAGAVNVGPIAGVIALIICFLFSSYNLYLDVVYGSKADKLGLAEVREIIKHDTLVKTHELDAIFT